jgi:hypothetical protein
MTPKNNWTGFQAGYDEAENAPNAHNGFRAVEYHPMRREICGCGAGGGTQTVMHCKTITFFPQIQAFSTFFALIFAIYA